MNYIHSLNFSRKSANYELNLATVQANLSAAPRSAMLLYGSLTLNSWLVGTFTGWHIRVIRREGKYGKDDRYSATS